MAKVILESSDKKSFPVDVDIAKMSKTIKTMMEDGVCDDEGDVFPVPKVRGDILKLVIDWAEHHREDPQDDQRIKSSDEIPEWDQDFLKIEISILYDLINAANYLDIEGLLDVTVKTIANMIKGKKPEEIRSILHIKEDFGEGEEEQASQENEVMDQAN